MPSCWHVSQTALSATPSTAPLQTGCSSVTCFAACDQRQTPSVGQIEPPVEQQDTEGDATEPGRALSFRTRNLDSAALRSN